MKKLLTILFAGLLTLALTTACDSKQTPINDLQDLCEDLQANSKDYTEDDWAALEESLTKINDDIERHRSEYTPDEIREIGRLQGKCAGYMTKEALRNLPGQINSALKQVEGALDGMTDALSE